MAEHQLSNYKYEIVKAAPKYGQHKYIILLKNAKNNKNMIFSVKEEKDLEKWEGEFIKYCCGTKI